jgi:outer membrane protein assembly factor BamB
VPTRVFVSIVVMLFALPAFASDAWPDFRGPSFNGHASADAAPPFHWGEGKNVKWKTRIHDSGWSSPVVYGNQVWMTTSSKDGKKMWAICVNRSSGKVIKDLLLFQNKKPESLGNRLNGYASPSPVIDANRVYIHFGSYGTVAIDTKTFKIVWKRTDLPCRHFRGPGSSPLLYKGRLILTFDGIDHQYLVGLDANSGKNIWKTRRSTNFRDLDKHKKPRGNGDYRKAYSTPIVVTHNGVDQLISPGAKAAIAYDVGTGKELWQVEHTGYSVASRPVAHNGMVLINTGYGRAQLWAVKLGGKGKLGGNHICWKQTKAIPRRSSPLIVDSLIYAIDDDGVFSCLDANTGANVWRIRLDKQSFSASPVYAGGKIFLFSHEGIASVITPGRTPPDPKKILTNKLADGFMASPAVVGKAFYLRTKTHLYRIEQ